LHWPPLFIAPVSAQVALPTDRAVSEMMEGAHKSVKQFEKNMPSDFKRSTLRGEKTDVNVENFMKDYKAGVLAKALAAVETAVAGRTLPESATAAWGRIATAAQTIEQAFKPTGA
jgi:hypothetical protein